MNATTVDDLAMQKVLIFKLILHNISLGTRSENLSEGECHKSSLMKISNWF